MIRQATHVHAARRYHAVVPFHEVANVGGYQRMRSTGDRGIDHTAILDIVSAGSHRHIVGIVARHTRVSRRRDAAADDMREFASGSQARECLNKRNEPRCGVETRALPDQNVQQSGQHCVRYNQLDRPDRGMAGLHRVDYELR